MAILLQLDADSTAPTLTAMGPDSLHLASIPALRDELSARPDACLVVVGPDLDLAVAVAIAGEHRLARPGLGVVLIRNRVDSSVLKVALRAGIRDVVKSDDLGALAEACTQVRALASASSSQGATSGRPVTRGRAVTVFAGKGGCGKTTMATNLAAALADGGKKSVCLIDLDLAFGDVAITMQLTPSRTIADAAHLGGTLDGAAVRSLVVRHSAGLDVLAAPLEPGADEGLSAALVSDLLGVLKTMYDYVVVDSPPSFTDHVLAAFDASEHFLLMATLDIPALKNLKLTLETLAMLGYPREKWSVALNRSDAKVGLTPQDVEQTLGHPISVLVPSSRAVPTTINRGILIVLDQPNHPVSQAILRFARQLTASAPQPVGAVAVHRKERRGFSRLRRPEVTS